MAPAAAPIPEQMRVLAVSAYGPPPLPLRIDPAPA